MNHYLVLPKDSLLALEILVQLFSLHIHVFGFQILWNSTYCTPLFLNNHQILWNSTYCTHLFLNNHQTVLGPFWQTVWLKIYMKWNGSLHCNGSSNLNLLFVWLSASFVWWINLSVADALHDQDLQTAIDISLLVKSQTHKLKAIRIKVHCICFKL